eukprot:Nk52_evm22s2309 gene=Nk52_evmTU22s2309
MCLIEGTCIVLKEGNGTVPSEIEVSLSLVYNGDVDYGQLKSESYVNMPFPVLDSLNMAFTIATDAKRDLTSIVTLLTIDLEDFEEIGSFLSEGFPELIGLSISVQQTSRRTKIRHDLLKGLPKLKEFALYFDPSPKLYTSSLNTIPNLFSPFRCINDSSSSSDLHRISAGISSGDISLWRLDDICTKSPMTLFLSAVVLPIPAQSGPLRPFFSTPPIKITLETYPYPADMTGQKEAPPPVYWDMLCDSLQGIEDPTLCPFYVPSQSHQASTKFEIMNFASKTNVSAVYPSLYRERCPLALDLSSLSLESLTVDGFSLGIGEAAYFQGIQPLSITFRDCDLTSPSLLSSLNYSRLFRGITIRNVHIQPELAPVVLDMPAVCWGGRCEHIEVESSPGFALNFDNLSANDLSPSPNLNDRLKLAYSYLEHVHILRIGNVDKGDGFWRYLATRGTFVNHSLSIRQSYFTIDQLYSMFPCVDADARYGASAAEQCCQNVNAVSNFYFEVTLITMDIEQSYRHISPPVFLNRYWLCGITSLVMDGIPLLGVANGNHNYSNALKTLELQSSGLAVLQEGSLNQTNNVIIQGSHVHNITQTLSYTGLQSFDMSNGHVSKFDISSVGKSPLAFLVNGARQGLTYLSMQNNRISTLRIEKLYEYFQCYFPLPWLIIWPSPSEDRKCVIDFHRNSLSKVQIAYDIPVRGDQSHRNISMLYEDKPGFQNFEITYSAFANISIDISSNSLKSLSKASIHSIRGLRSLIIANNSMEMLEGGFISGPSCIGTGCYVDLSFNRLGENISALEEALRIQSRSFKDVVIHTLDLSHNNLPTFPKYSTAIAGALLSMIGKIARPNVAVYEQDEYRPSYFTLNLQFNNITFVGESLCFGIDPSEDVTIYVDLSHNPISYVSSEAFKCDNAKLMVNLNYNPLLQVLPTFWYGDMSSLMLLSLKNTSIRQIPKSYMVKEKVFALKSFNLDWSYEWSCCDLAYVHELDASASLVVTDPSTIGKDDNLLLQLENERRRAANGYGTYFKSKECVYENKKWKYLEFHKAFPDTLYTCGENRVRIGTTTRDFDISEAVILLWVILYIVVVMLSFYYLFRSMTKKRKSVQEMAFSLRHLFIICVEEEQEYCHPNFLKSETGYYVRAMSHENDPIRAMMTPTKRDSKSKRYASSTYSYYELSCRGIGRKKSSSSIEGKEVNGSTAYQESSITNNTE